MLDAVYVNAKKTKLIIGTKPKLPPKPVFQVVASREGSDICILNKPLEGSSLFQVETGEGWSPPETILDTIICTKIKKSHDLGIHRGPCAQYYHYIMTKSEGDIL